MSRPERFCPTCGASTWGSHPVVRRRRHQTRVLPVPESWRGKSGRSRQRPDTALRVYWPVVQLRRGGPMRNSSTKRDHAVCPDPFHGPLDQRMKRWSGEAAREAAGQARAEAAAAPRPDRDGDAIERRRRDRTRTHRERQGRNRR